MIMDIVWLVAGLVLILVGANILTEGASAIARRIGVSELVVGLTVVAFGTSPCLPPWAEALHWP